MGSHRGKLSELLHNKRKSVLAINFSLLGFYTGHRIASSKPAKHQLTPAIPTIPAFLQERDGKLCPIPSLVLRLTLTNQTCLFWTTWKKLEKKRRNHGKEKEKRK